MKSNTEKQEQLKIKAAGISAAAIAIAIIAGAGALSLRTDGRALTAEPVRSASAAVKTEMPPREYDVKISVDGRNIGVRCAGTVSDALDAANVSVFDDDLINIGLNEPLNERTKIVINRVDIVEDVEVRPLEYATKYREDDDYLVGYSETIVDGEKGEIETTTRNVYVDGELVSSSVIDEDITEPVDEIIVIGTKEEEPEPVVFEDTPVPAASSNAQTVSVDLDANGVPREYQYMLTGSSCAYTASAGAMTSTGVPAAVGRVAVDPDVIPYGTELYITSADGSRVYGYAVAADTGGSVRRGTIIVDLYMDTESQCYDWGRRDVNIYVL